MSKLFLFTLSLYVLCFAAQLDVKAEAADKKLSAADFLYRVRHPAGRKRWAIMDGEVIHRRRGQDTVKAKLYLGILFSNRPYTGASGYQQKPGIYGRTGFRQRKRTVLRSKPLIKRRKKSSHWATLVCAPRI